MMFRKLDRRRDLGPEIDEDRRGFWFPTPFETVSLGLARHVGIHIQDEASIGGVEAEDVECNVATVVEVVRESLEGIFAAGGPTPSAPTPRRIDLEAREHRAAHRYPSGELGGGGVQERIAVANLRAGWLWRWRMGHNRRVDKSGFRASGG